MILRNDILLEVRAVGSAGKAMRLADFISRDMETILAS